GDGITSATAVTLSGSAEPGAAIALLDSAAGNTPVGTTIADATGHWQYAIANLTVGQHGFTGTATDGVGNSTTSAALPLTVHAPVTPTILGFTSQGRTSGHLTNADSVALDGIGEAGSTIQVLDGSNAVDSTQVLSNGHWQLSVAGLTDGLH